MESVLKRAEWSVNEVRVIQHVEQVQRQCECRSGKSIVRKRVVSPEFVQQW